MAVVGVVVVAVAMAMVMAVAVAVAGAGAGAMTVAVAVAMALVDLQEYKNDLDDSGFCQRGFVYGVPVAGSAIRLLSLRDRSRRRHKITLSH